MYVKYESEKSEVKNIRSNIFFKSFGFNENPEILLFSHTEFHVGN